MLYALDSCRILCISSDNLGGGEVKKRDIAGWMNRSMNSEYVYGEYVRMWKTEVQYTTDLGLPAASVLLISKENFSC